ncbi:unnamed protein product [Phytophthora lilii]|uniref:Unnamed protein product n=1 Tax=Phytophthora lilii TaxID=2077276 RepID=A0A9W6U2D0_9STRA|nr:unnamed protein product [Phytophthora lilii]
MPNYKDEAGEIVRRLMIVELGRQVPDDESFIDRSNEFRETANNSYGFAMGNVAYEEGAEISRSEMRRHLLVWMQEKFGLDKLPKEQLKPQEIERAHSKIKYVEMKICTHCGNKHTKDCCNEYECNARSTKRYFINAKLLSLIRVENSSDSFFDN